MKRWHQRGAALLAAMLTVALVATFAAAALWQQWRSVEVEAAERWRLQSGWLLTGALDWARLVLREDRGQTDHLGEPWAVPLQEARLSTFLAADPNNNVAGDSDGDSANVFLSGQIIDLQSLLNVNNLVEAGKPYSETWMKTFQRLFELLGLPPAQLARLAENLRFASDISVDNRSAARAPLPPQNVEQLAWLGLPLETVRALGPYVTVLPQAGTKVNLNTAGAEVIYAVGNGISLAEAQRLVAERERKPLDKLADAAQVLGRAEAPAAPGSPATGPFSDLTAGVNTIYFEIRGRLRSDEVVIEQRSMIRREGSEIRPIQRQQGVFEGAAPLPR